MKNNYLKLGRLALVLLCLMCAVTPIAAMQFTASNIKAAPGKTVDLPIEVNAESDILAFQFDVALPNGFEVVDHEFTRMVSRSSMKNADMGTGICRVICFERTLEQPSVKAGSGKILTLYLKVPEDASGTYACSINNISIIRFGDRKEIQPESTHFVITCPVHNPTGPVSIGDTFTVSGIYYRVTGPSDVEVTYRDENYNSYSGAVSVPPEVTYGDVTYTVSAIGESAFYQCSSLTKVELPTTIRAFKFQAFSLCQALAEINLPEGLVSMGDYSFGGYPKMTSLVIPSTLTKISNRALLAMPNLRHIEVAKGNPVFDSRGDCNAIIRTETNELMRGCINTVIPEDVRIIGENAFQGCPITSIEIPKNVQTIKLQAFVGSALKSVFIPEHVKLVDDFAFCNCKDLESVTFAGSAELGFGVFNGSNALASVTVLAPLAKMRTTKCFDDETYKNATLYTIYENMSSYDSYKDWQNFKNIRLKYYDYYVDGIYYMRNGADCLWVSFKDENYNSYRCSQLRIPANVYINGKNFRVTEIRRKAFYNCSNLKYVTLPENSVSVIQTYAFANCTSLQEIRIPYQKGDFHLQGASFSGCTNLKKVFLTAECDFKYDYNIFSGCNNLTSVVCVAPTPLKMNTSIFTEATYAKTPLYVKQNSVAAYKRDASWGKFKKIIGLTDAELQQRYDSMTEVKGKDVSSNELVEGENSYFNGKPSTTGTSVNDHLFVCQDGEGDDVVTLTGDTNTLVKVWLDDDEIYTNQKVQALVSYARDGKDGYYNEVTYSSVQFDLYLPMNVEFSKNLLVKGDRMPAATHLLASDLLGTKEINGKDYQIYRVVAVATNSVGGHFSGKNITYYHKHGAMKKRDGYLLGFRLKNTDPNVDRSLNNDFIIANVEFVIQETAAALWPMDDSLFFYGTGGQGSPVFLKYHYVKLNYK